MQVHRILSKKGPYVVEHKLDGERVMFHYRRGAQPQWWTRNCNDFSAQYNEPMRDALASCLPASLTDCLLDGEMMVWNRDTGEYAAFGENRSLNDYRRRMDCSQQACYVVFDALWLNGESLVQLPLSERRAKVEHLIRWEEHSLQLSAITPVDSTTEIMAALDRAMSKGYEGSVFKSLGAPYVPAARDHDWIKLKPDYVNGMGDNLDLLIIGGYYGEGASSLYLPCTFPVPSLYLDLLIIGGYYGEGAVESEIAVYIFPAPSLYLPCTFPVRRGCSRERDRSLHRISAAFD
jgi:DNA ligase-4